MKFNCGIIGLGRIGCGFDDNPNSKTINTHAGAYFNNKNTNLVSLCDIDKSKLQKYGRKYNVESKYDDYEKMFNEEDLDCISICTHAESHLEIVKLAAKHGVKGIFLEKPMSDSLKSATEIIKICKKHNIKLQVDHFRRFIPVYRKLANEIKNGVYGELQGCTFYFGAGIANTGSHIFDLIRMFFGDIKWIEANRSKNDSNNTNDPNLDVLVHCKNNINCNLLMYNLKNFGINEMNLFSINSRIKINLMNNEVHIFKPLKNSGLAYSDLREKFVIKDSQQQGIVLGLQELLKSIKDDSTTSSTGKDGYKSIEAIIASNISAKKNGKRVNLPIKSYSYRISSKWIWKN